MRMKSWRCYRSKYRIVEMVLMLMLMALLTACGLRLGEENAPKRSFEPEALLIGTESFPSGWYTFDPILPVGDNLVTRESVCQGFGKTVNDEQVGSAAQCIYRQLHKEGARRRFEHVYLSPTKQSLTVSDWTYQSKVAEQSLFWCAKAPDGSGHLVCEWGGQYEEYIVTFQMRLTPGEVSLADMERLVKAIDLRMSEYLDLPSDSIE